MYTYTHAFKSSITEPQWNFQIGIFLKYQMFNLEWFSQIQSNFEKFLLELLIGNN